MKKLQILGLSLAFALGVTATFTGEAHAQKKKPEVFEIGPINITARPTRPSAVVELGKILPEVELAKVQKSFSKLIAEALLNDPF
jgi:hypothetical protein